jgi:hypothetical protein
MDRDRLFLLLSRVSPYQSREGFEPIALIRAENALQPLGKDRALAVVREFLRTSRFGGAGHGGVFLVLRTLFDSADPRRPLPRMGVGAPIPEEPRDPAALPRFPVAIVDDVPFLRRRPLAALERAEGRAREDEAPLGRPSAVVRAPGRPCAAPARQRGIRPGHLEDGRRRNEWRDAGHEAP